MVCKGEGVMYENYVYRRAEGRNCAMMNVDEINFFRYGLRLVRVGLGIYGKFYGSQYLYMDIARREEEKKQREETSRRRFLSSTRR